MQRIHPEDDGALAEGAAVLAASDKDLWPDTEGLTLRDLTAFARYEGTDKDYVMVAARSAAGGPILGVGLVEVPLRENTHSVEITVAVHPEHRRQGVGTAIVDAVGEMARANGRRTINSIVDVPVSRAADHASHSFAPKVGFVPSLAGNTRRLDLPLSPDRRAELDRIVAEANGANDYRVMTFLAPWPQHYREDESELLRVMSTDEPAGDSDREEEIWTMERLEEHDALDRARGATRLAAVAEHIPSGRLVAMSELLVCADTPRQAWQLITVVHPGHRGHRLGLAVKLANLDFVAEQTPRVEYVITGNAAVNAPMIAVNDLMGFRVQGEGSFWQKHLDDSSE